MKWLKAWLAKRRGARRAAERDRGFDYAAGVLLSHNGVIDPRKTVCGDIFYDDFDRGIEDACDQFRALTGIEPGAPSFYTSKKGCRNGS